MIKTKMAMKVRKGKQLKDLVKAVSDKRSKIVNDRKKDSGITKSHTDVTKGLKSRKAKKLRKAKKTRKTLVKKNVNTRWLQL
jgi:hypothetical protein